MTSTRTGCLSEVSRSIVVLLVMAVTSPASLACESLEACIALYPEAAVEGRGIQTDLARRVQNYGPDAIPHLILLLEHENAAVRKLAGYTIRDIDGLAPEHLEPLMRAREKGDGWIPPAIARIGTREAIEFLVNDLRKRPQTHSQVTYAFEILGANGAPFIAQLFACTDACNERVLDAAFFVLGELGEDAVAAIPRLLQVAENDRFTPVSRQYAIAVVGQIGSSAEPHVPELLALREKEPLLASAVDHALLHIGSSEAVAPLLRVLPNDTEHVLLDIRSLGGNGYDAGPAVLAYLNDPDWDVRVAAAETLGHIGYSPASSALARTLTDKDDWKLVYAASLSLGRLDADEFIEALESVRDTHWYPPVRDVANSAIQHIKTGKAMDEEGWSQLSSFESSSGTCDAANYRAVDEPAGTKLDATDDSEKLKRLSYQTAIYSYGEPEGTEPNEQGIIEISDANMVEHVERVRQVPEIALKVPSGWLVGADRGEWGGELVHIPTRGNSAVLYDGNVEDIFPLGDQIIATAGLAHLVSNQGLLLRIDEIETGRFTAIPWKRLPGAPASSWLIEGGELLVNTYDGGSIVVDSDGTLRMAECVSAQTSE